MDDREVESGGGEGDDDDGDEDGERKSRGLILPMPHGLNIPMEDDNGQWKY